MEVEYRSVPTLVIDGMPAQEFHEMLSMHDSSQDARMEQYAAQKVLTGILLGLK